MKIIGVALATLTVGASLAFTEPKPSSDNQNSTWEQDLKAIQIVAQNSPIEALLDCQSLGNYKGYLGASRLKVRVGKQQNKLVAEVGIIHSCLRETYEPIFKFCDQVSLETKGDLFLVNGRIDKAGEYEATGEFVLSVGLSPDQTSSPRYDHSASLQKLVVNDSIEQGTPYMDDSLKKMRCFVSPELFSLLKKTDSQPH